MHTPGLLFAAGLAVLATAAQAQDCAPPRLLATLPMQSAEPQSHIRTVPVTLNGIEKQMVLDTGGALTQLARATITELNLPLRRGGAAVFDINGRVSRHYTQVAQFQFGDTHRINAAFMMWPEPARPFAGEIAQDLLAAYDVEIDFAANLMRLYSRNHCAGKPGWSRTDASRLPMANRNWHLHIPVTLDGRSYDGIFDTGSRHTIMRLPTAKRDFGITLDTPGLEPVRAINNHPSLDGYLHTFSRLSLGDAAVTNPEIMIVPDIMNRNADTSPVTRNRAYRHNANLVLPALSVGMDVLKDLHLYIAFGEGALYVAPARPADTGKP